MGSTALALAGLSITVWAQIASGQSSIDSWSLTGLKVQSVPEIWIMDGTEFVSESPREGEGFLEFQGRLKVPPGARFDPVALSEVRVRTVESTARAQSAFAVGSSIAMCRYLPRDPHARDVSKMAVGQGRSLAVSRDNPGALLKLTVEGASVDLCIAFARPDKLGESLLLEFAGQSFTVPLADKPKQAADSKRNIPPTLPGKSLIFSRTALIAAALLVLGFAVVAIWRWRARSASIPERESGREAECCPTGPRRVSAEHCRTSFIRVGANVGPGKADFEAALREIQFERFSEADALLAQAITKGLPGTFKCGAWLLRGQAAVGLGHIQLAIDYFLNALDEPELTIQAALPAALHLAAIYRALGLRADAEKMDAVVSAAGGKDSVLEPETIQRIKEHSQAYKKALRAARPSRLRALAGRVFKRLASTSAT